MRNESLQIVVCPECKGQLKLQQKLELWCQPCGYAFPIDNGIPVMIVEKARKLTADEKLEK